MATPEQLLTLAVFEAPGVIRESIRAVLIAHGFTIVHVVDVRTGELARLTHQRIEQLLRELGNNVTQALYSLERTR